MPLSHLLYGGRTMAALSENGRCIQRPYGVSQYFNGLILHIEFYCSFFLSASFQSKQGSDLPQYTLITAFGL